MYYCKAPFGEDEDLWELEKCAVVSTCRPRSNTIGSLGPPDSAPKRHIDQFNRFCTAHGRDQQTHRQTDHATPSVA